MEEELCFFTQESNAFKDEIEVQEQVRLRPRQYSIDEFAPSYPHTTIKSLEDIKRIYGIQMLFGLQPVVQSEFINEIGVSVFGGEEELSSGLNNLFRDNKQNPHEPKYATTLRDLADRLSEIQKRAFGGISMNKTTGSAFFRHFRNYLEVGGRSRLIEGLVCIMDRMLQDASAVAQPGGQLLSIMYDSWMRSFSEFVKDIWRHSDRYTSELRQKVFPMTPFKSSSSTSESQVHEQRKTWKQFEVDVLSQVIQDRRILDRATVNELSIELSRSPNSICSKVQKLTKKTGSIAAESLCLQKKLQRVLEECAEGLTRDQVMTAMCQDFNMEPKASWERSVTQLLSSKKNIERMKGAYILKDQFRQIPESTLTIRDRLTCCLLKLNKQQCNLPNIVRTYKLLYTNEHDSTRNLENSIYKALHRYDIFEKSKTIYRLIKSPT